MDEQPVTYQQLLAEQYEENANQILAFAQTEYDQPENDSSEYVIDTYGSERGVRGQALEDSYAFQKFAGNRNLEEDVIRPREFEDKSKFSVRYNKDVKVNTFNIDSRFRAYINPGVLLSNAMINPANPINENIFQPTATSLASHFVFRMNRQIKNAISMKLSSLELPNTFANFSNARGNTSFQIRVNGHSTYTTINIDSDDIPEYYPNVNFLADAIETKLKVFNGGFNCTVNNEGYIEITNSSGGSYDFNFGYTPSSLPLYESLGVAMGFKADSKYYQNINFAGSSKITATYLPDLNTDDYIYIRINDYVTVTPQTINDTFFSVFAKIPVKVDKGQIIFDNDSSNSINKTYRFLLPTNVQQLEIQLLDKAGNELTFDGNYSMTLEIEELLNQSLYEKMREL